MSGSAFGSRLGWHLGTRASALLDGQLAPAEEERAWRHVRACEACCDLVRREGWIKTQLAGLCSDEAAAPPHLKGILRDGLDGPWRVPDQSAWPLASAARHRLAVGVIGGGAVGAAMVGVLLLSAPPAQAPAPDRRAPAAGLTLPSAPSPLSQAARRDQRSAPAVSVRRSAR